MNCSIFRKRLEDYLEGCISYDLKKAMDNHINSCESCRDLYHTELYIDRILKEGMQDEEVEFNSIAEDVMKSIDKKQYSKASASKVYHSLSKHSMRYASLAAVLVLCIAMAPMFINQKLETKHSQKSASAVQKNMAAQNVAIDNQINPASQKILKDEALSIKSVESAGNGSGNRIGNLYGNALYAPKMIKKVVTSQPSSNTPWESSPSRNYTACIDGIGEKAQEQGMSKIIINSLVKNEMWSFEILEESNTRLNTPKNLEWCDDENLLIVLSFSQGHISSGDLYVMNINTSEIKPVYDVPNKLNKIASVVKSGSDLILDMEIYDENLNKYYAEKWTLKGYGTKSKEISVIDSKGAIVDKIIN